MKFNEYDKAQKKYGVNRGEGNDWMQLKEGDNIVRIVTEFEDFGSHYSKKDQQSYVCIGKDECPFCQDEKARAQFLGWVIDRDGDQFKLLRIGYSIFGSIGDYAETEGYEFDTIPDYDFIIKRSGTGLETEYGVIPRKKSESLTEEQEEQIKNLTPPEEIIESMKENTKQLASNSQESKKPEWWPLYEEEDDERPENPLKSAEGAKIEFLEDRLPKMDLDPDEVVFKLNNRNHGEKRELELDDLTEGDAWDLCQAMIQEGEQELRKYIVE